MTIKALVFSDEVKTYVPKGQTETRTVRTLALIDMDDGHRVPMLMKMSIPISSSVAGDARQGANLRDTMVTCAIKGLRIFEWDRSLGLEGDVIQVGGHFTETKPANAQKGS
jgi:hypothetical protein